MCRLRPFLETFAFAALLCPAALRAQTTQSSLQALDSQVRALYEQAEKPIARVQVPVRVPFDHPLIKWRDELDPALRRMLDTARARGQSPHLFVEPPATRPSESRHASGERFDEVRIPLPAPTPVLRLECAGIILDAQGDVLLPIFIDKDDIDQPMPVTLAGARATTAKFVAADRQTSLSVVRLADPAGPAARLAGTRPSAGSMVLMISALKNSARLGLWTSGQEGNAIAVNLAGEVAALVRNGHAMYPRTFSPIVDQLLRYGQVRRARLGVAIRDVGPDDPQRADLAALGGRPAVRVEQVQADSAAASGGIQAGDIILSIAGQPVDDVPNFSAAVAVQRGRTDLLILREGHRQTITVDLEPQ